MAPGSSWPGFPPLARRPLPRANLTETSRPCQYSGTVASGSTMSRHA